MFQLGRKPAPSISANSLKAFQEREAIDLPRWQPWATQIGEGFVKEQRHKNFFENSEKFPLVRDIVKVQIMPTVDGGFTVSLIAVDDTTCTLWMHGELPQRKPPIDGANQMYSNDETVFPVASITSY
jgi:hypothetical protein